MNPIAKQRKKSLRSLSSLLIASIISSAITLPVLAQDTNPNEFLDFDTVSIVSGYQVERKKAAAVVRVITRDEIERYGYTSLGDVLRTIPGISVSPSADATATLLTSRGTTSRLLTMFNGIETASGSVDAFGDVDNIPLNDVEYIEIMRGPNSSVFGADAVLGVVNIVTSTKAGNESRVSVRAGSFDSYGVEGVYVGKINNRRISFSASTSTTDGFSPQVEFDQQTQFDALFGTNASLAPGNGNDEATVNEARFYVDLTDSLSFTAHYYEQKDIGSGVGFAQALDTDGGISFDSFIGTLQYKQSIANWDTETNIIYYNAEGIGDSSLFPNGAFGGFFPEGVNQVLGAEENRFKLETSAFRDFGAHTLRVGFNYLDSKWDNIADERNFIFAPGFPFPIPNAITEFAGTDQAFFLDYDYTLTSGFISNEWSFANDWTLLTGVRYDDHSVAGSNVSPKISLVWNKSLFTTFKLSYGEAFRPPSATELSSNGFFIALGNRDLNATTLESLEFIAENEFSEQLSSTLSLFTYRNEDFIVSVDSDVSPNGQAFINSDDPIEGSGVELSFVYKPTDYLTVIPSWSYTDLRDSNLNSQASTRVPKNLGKLQASITLPSDFTATVFSQYVADRERSFTDLRDDVDDYFVTDFSLHKRNLFSNFDVVVRVKNVFDEDALEPISLGIPNDYQIYGRSFELQLNMDF